MIRRSTAAMAMATGLCALASPLHAAARPLLPDVDPPEDDPGLVSLHAAELRAHRDDPPPEPGPPLDPAVIAAARAWEEGGGRQTRARYEVIGYLPYWEETGGLRLDVLTQVNWFAAEMSSSGDLTSLHGWGDAACQQLITQAHAEGCRVSLVTTNFSSSGIHGIVSSATNRANAIDNLLEQVVAMGADGVDVDFEGMSSSDRNDLLTFMEEMTAAFEAEIPGAWLTLATPAIDWSGAYDYDELIARSSGLFIMGYPFHGTWGDPGPVAPKDGGSTWGTYSLRWSVEDYVEYAGTANLPEVYLGLPLYGYDWEAASTSVPTTAVGSCTAIWIDDAMAEAATYGMLWDAESSTPYYNYGSGTNHQVWYDNVDSVLSKIDLAEDYELGGFGFWALQYDGNDPELWDAIAALNGDDDDDAADDDDDATDDDDDVQPGAPVAVVDEHVYVNIGETAVLDGSESHDPDGDPLTFRWTQTDGDAVELDDETAAVASFVATTAGQATFELVVSDGSLDSDPAQVVVRVFPAGDGADGKGCDCGLDPAVAPGSLAATAVLAAVLALLRRRRG